MATWWEEFSKKINMNSIKFILCCNGTSFFCTGPTHSCPVCTREPEKIPNGRINYQIRGRNLHFSHPHRLKRLQLQYTVDPSGQLLQRVKTACTTAVLVINIHCFGNPARMKGKCLEKASQRARAEDNLIAFYEAASTGKQSKLRTTDTKTDLCSPKNFASPNAAERIKNLA